MRWRTAKRVISRSQDGVPYRGHTLDRAVASLWRVVGRDIRRREFDRPSTGNGGG